MFSIGKIYKMTIRRKVERTTKLEQEIISRGGEVAEEKKIKKRLRLVLEIPYELLETVDKDRRSRTGFVSRNTWILEAINQKLLEINQ